MEHDNTLLLNIWELTRGYCPAKKRDELAHRLLHIFEDHGADSSLFDQLCGEDFNLDNAIDEWQHDTEENNSGHGDEYFLEDEDN